MNSKMILPAGLAVSLALMAAACSKPAEPVVADTSGAAPAPATSPTEPGGAVSPGQANGAVNTDANKTSDNVVAASNSFTEGQAKGHIENAGYTDVTGLTKSPDGLWIASAKKAGKAVNVTVDFKGAVVAN